MSKRKKFEKYSGERRTPNPQRRVEAEAPKKRYKPVTFALSPSETSWVDDITNILRDSGRETASRSLVIREAILSLQQLLQGKNPDAIYRFFSDQELRRARKR